MAKQYNRRGRRDKRVFKKTAERTKKINVRPLQMRGGIRL